MLLFLSFPSAFWMSVIYNEALFLCTLFGFLYFYQVEKSYKSVIFDAARPYHINLETKLRLTPTCIG